MSNFQSQVKRYFTADQMASAYLRELYPDTKIEYPVNPFKMLNEEGILFSFRSFGKLEGVYIPAEDINDSPVVGINIHRPITRQRFTAAHELCHHLKDSKKQRVCEIGEKSDEERFADDFAAALLMPITELRKQVESRKENGYVSFDSVLEIADYFGVSFETCLYRIAYRIHAISGNVDSYHLKRRISNYSPDKKRQEKGMYYLKLYEGLIDSYRDNLHFSPNDHAKFVFQNNYIYNDSRMEGVNISIEDAAEIVTDLRIHKQHSQYCKDENEAYMSIAGHYQMYNNIFETPVK